MRAGRRRLLVWCVSRRLTEERGVKTFAATEKWREGVAGWEHTGVGVQFCFVELVDYVRDGLDCAVPGTWSALDTERSPELPSLDERELLTS